MNLSLGQIRTSQNPRGNTGANKICICCIHFILCIFVFINYNENKYLIALASTIRIYFLKFYLQKTFLSHFYKIAELTNFGDNFFEC